MFSAWLTPPIVPHLSVYVFNITNPEEVGRLTHHHHHHHLCQHSFLYHHHHPFHQYLRLCHQFHRSKFSTIKIINNHGHHLFNGCDHYSDANLRQDDKATHELHASVKFQCSRRTKMLEVPHNDERLCKGLLKKKRTPRISL